MCVKKFEGVLAKNIMLNHFIFLIKWPFHAVFQMFAFDCQDIKGIDLIDTRRWENID